ncbi:hypothetical protein DL96DRAFT_1589918 [Flagelloscypha sp. PMI_526]|nr:hypothetical protein DL96DRAFT_1589918 [Flagelloscypha sp. PMI_526]
MEAFSIPELCNLVCIHCDFRTCVCLARTARVFLEPCLDRIWEHPTSNVSSPLFNGISSTSSDPKMPESNPSRTLTRADYHRLQSFSKWIRTLWRPTPIFPILPQSYLQDLINIATFDSTVPPLFEKLQTLAFEVELGGEPSLSEKALAKLFLCSSIQVLHLSLSNAGGCSEASYERLISLLSTHCPSLQSLTVWKMQPSDCDTLLTMISRGIHMQQRRVRLSRMKKLHSLHLGGTIVADDEPKFPTWRIRRPQEEFLQWVQSLGFHLRFQARVDLFEASFLSQPRSLRFLKIVFEGAFDATTLARIFRRAAKHSNLTTLKLKAIHVSLLPRCHAVRIEDLRILGQASNLQVLHLELRSYFRKHDLAECMASWPLLTELVLVHVSRTTPPSRPALALKSLITISQGCRNLRLLKISINLNYVPGTISIGSMNLTSFSLTCVESTMTRHGDELERLFGHLVSIFPNIFEVRKEAMYEIDEEVENAWSKLQRMVEDRTAKQGAQFHASI